MKLIGLTVLSLFLKTYLVLYLAVVLHELAHFVTAKLIGLSDVFLCIGFHGVLGFKGKNFFISSLAFSGYVSVDTVALRSMSKWKQACFWMAGLLANLFGMAVGLISGQWLVTLINFAVVLACGIPLPIFNSDIYCFLQEKQYWR